MKKGTIFGPLKAFEETVSFARGQLELVDPKDGKANMVQGNSWADFNEGIHKKSLEVAGCSFCKTNPRCTNLG